MTGHACGKQGDANNQGNEPAAHLRFHGLTLFFRSVAAACQCFPQHLKNDCSRPPEQQHSVHSGHWAQQPPTLHWNNVAVSKCCIVDECKIKEVGTEGAASNIEYANDQTITSSA